MDTIPNRPPTSTNNSSRNIWSMAGMSRLEHLLGTVQFHFNDSLRRKDRQTFHAGASSTPATGDAIGMTNLQFIGSADAVSLHTRRGPEHKALGAFRNTTGRR